jgi:hypothetical protein
VTSHQRSAAREADVVQIIPQTRADGSGLDVAGTDAAALAQKIGWVREAAGARFDQVELSAYFLHMVVTDRPREAAEQLVGSSPLIAGLSAEQILASPFVLLGSVDAIVERPLALRERHGISHVWVYPHDTEALAPVVARLAGR